MKKITSATAIAIILLSIAIAGYLFYLPPLKSFCEEKGYEFEDMTKEEVYCSKPTYYCEGEICVKKSEREVKSFSIEMFEVWKIRNKVKTWI